MTHFVKLIDYNIWANNRIGDQIRGLPPDFLYKELGGSFPSLRLILIHLLESDWIWMNRWKGIPLAKIPEDWSTDNADSIMEIWRSIQTEAKKAVVQLANEPTQTIQFTTRKGDPLAMSFEDTLIHAVNHGTYHRGQIVNMIRMLGQKPVNTDYFIFCSL